MRNQTSDKTGKVHTSLKDMSSNAPFTTLVGKRKRKKDPNPNPLFSRWLTEWKDEAKEKGWKSEYIYSKALKSLQKFPLPLATGKECKILQHVGDKICKMLDDRLLTYNQEQESLAKFKGYDVDLPLPVLPAKSSSCSRAAHPQVAGTVHEISDSSDDNDANAGGHREHSRSKQGQYSNSDRFPVKTTMAGGNSAQRSASPAFTFLENGFPPDEDVSIIGHTPPVGTSTTSTSATNRLSYPYDMSDDDLPTLPSLPCLAEGSDDARTAKGRQVGRFETNSAGGVGSSCAVVTARVSHSVSDSDGDGGDQAAPPQQVRRRAGGVRQPREYVPAFRSGPYAILLTLFRQSQHPDFRGFMTKAELSGAAQPLADKSFSVPDPGSRYTAWSSVSILVKKGYLTRESSPAKYRLTDQGYELARRLEDVERRPTAGEGAGDGGPDDRDRPEGPCQVGVSASIDETEIPDDNACIIVEDREAGDERDEDDDDDDDLPPLTLPSLAQRLQPASSASVSRSTSASENTDRKLHFWYVAEGDTLVTSKSQAAVAIDEFGVSFLVKINYQHLLQCGCRYKLDMTRPLGDDFVFAYIPDADCFEDAHPPVNTPEDQTPEDQTACSATVSMSQSAHPSRSTYTAMASTDRPLTVGVTGRPVHNISDSDSDPGMLPSNPAIKTHTAHHRKQPSVRPNIGSKPPPTSRSVSRGISSLAAGGKSVGLVTTGAESGNGVGSAASAKSKTVGGRSLDVQSVRSTTVETVEDFVLRPGTFEVVLCVDNREFYGSHSSSKSLLPDLIKNGVTCDLRLLNVGDLLWVAREKAAPGLPLGMLGNEQQPRRELVLNYIVERKRMDDLVSSMTGGRLKEQKFRLKHSGLQEKIILVESYGSMQHFSISEDRIKQSMANTELIDGFTVKRTRDSKETAAYLTLMTRYLQSYYQYKTLRSSSQESIKELGIKFDVHDTEQMLMPFEHFNQASMKNKPLTVLELLAKQLIQLWGMSAEKAKAIVDKYPTPSSLFTAYAACSSDKERDSLLANLKYGKNLRNLGIAVSRQVAQLYTSRVLT